MWSIKYPFDLFKTFVYIDDNSKEDQNGWHVHVRMVFNNSLQIHSLLSKGESK